MYGLILKMNELIAAETYAWAGWKLHGMILQKLFRCEHDSVSEFNGISSILWCKEWQFQGRTQITPFPIITLTFFIVDAPINEGKLMQYYETQCQVNYLWDTELSQNRSVSPS